MESTVGDALVDSYLQRIAAAAADLPPDRRDELVEIADALGRGIDFWLSLLIASALTFAAYLLMSALLARFGVTL